VAHGSIAQKPLVCFFFYFVAALTLAHLARVAALIRARPAAEM